MWKNVGASKVSVIYIYIYIDNKKKKKKKLLWLTHIAL